MACCCVCVCAFEVYFKIVASIPILLVFPYRFSYSNALSQLPQWVQPHVKSYDKFGLVQRDLRSFFRNAEQEVRTFEFLH